MLAKGAFCVSERPHRAVSHRPSVFRHCLRTPAPIPAVCQSCYGARRPLAPGWGGGPQGGGRTCNTPAHATALHMQQPCTRNSPARAADLHGMWRGLCHMTTKRLEVL
eukprot:364693-Chlamydomonas_euryale.AAC.12